MIHCAGLAHQKITSPLGSELYDQINCQATENLANAAIQANPDVWIIFLSSISVYGEKPKTAIVKETDSCFPTSDYALSKLNAERKLKGLYDGSIAKKLDILRLAPVYDWNWSLNLNKRVFSPYKLFYLKYGSGEQKISVVNRKNLADFIEFRLKHNTESSFYNVFNVCDKNPCTFNEIISVFKRSGLQPNRITLKIPLGAVWFLTKVAGLLLKKKKAWGVSIYDKLANSLVFDNQRMLDTGFRPKQSLASVFGEGVGGSPIVNKKK